VPGRRLDGSLPLNPGKLRDYLTVQREMSIANGYGEDSPLGFATVVEIWGNVRAMSGAEMERVQQRWADARFRIRTWFVPVEIRRADSIRWGTRTLDILDVEDPDGLRRELLITCRELT
jgi:SPP1 family predicted phage head-tail adaptor